MRTQRLYGSNKRQRIATDDEYTGRLSKRDMAYSLPTPPSTRSRRTTLEPERTPSKRRKRESSADPLDTLSTERSLRKRSRRPVVEPPTPRSTPSRSSRRNTSLAPTESTEVDVEMEVDEEEVEVEAVKEETANEESEDVVEEAVDDEEEEVALKSRQIPLTSSPIKSLFHDIAALHKPLATPLTPMTTPTKSRTPSKRKAAKLADKPEESDEETYNDENVHIVLPHDLLDQREHVTPHQTIYAAKYAQPLLHSVLNVVYGREQPPALANGSVDTVAGLAKQPCLPTLETWEMDVRLQLDRTIREGEGNCMLVLGPQGVGKTAMINRSLKLLEQAHGVDSFITIRISGSVSTNDRMTLREIARQLCTDDAGIDDDGSSFTSHAVILQSLLTLLEPQSSTASSSSATLDRSKPLIFILDDFDRFAERDERQSFLYCLLDIVQSKRRKGGMAVVGVSTRVDCLDRLEKRVRSRCQSRVLRVVPPIDVAAWHSIVRTVLSRPATDRSLVAKAWNRGVEDFLADVDVVRALRTLYELRANTGELLQNLGVMISRHAHAVKLGKNFALPCLKASDLPIARPQTERFPLTTLPIVSLAVLIAAKHATASSPKSFITPAAISDRYTRWCRSQTGVKHRPLSPLAITRALESLITLGAITDAMGVSWNAVQASATSPYRRLRLVCWTRDLDLAIKSRKDVPVPMRQWCMKAL